MTRWFCEKCGLTKNCIAPEHSGGDRVEHCAKCHGAVVRRAELKLASGEFPTPHCTDEIAPGVE